jgi:hypothetical protein
MWFVTRPWWLEPIGPPEGWFFGGKQLKKESIVSSISREENSSTFCWPIHGMLEHRIDIYTSWRTWKQLQCSVLHVMDQALVFEWRTLSTLSGDVDIDSVDAMDWALALVCNLWNSTISLTTHMQEKMDWKVHLKPRKHDSMRCDKGKIVPSQWAWPRFSNPGANFVHPSSRVVKVSENNIHLTLCLTSYCNITNYHKILNKTTTWNHKNTS